MAREVIDVTIDNDTYTITQYPLKQSINILSKLMKLIGPSLQKIIQGYDDKKSFLEQDLSKLDIGGAVAIIGANLSDDQGYELMKEITSCAIHKGKGRVSEIFDAHFHSRLGHLLKLCRHCIEVNYKNFFQELTADLKTQDQQ